MYNCRIFISTNLWLNQLTNFFIFYVFHIVCLYTNIYSIGNYVNIINALQVIFLCKTSKMLITSINYILKNILPQTNPQFNLSNQSNFSNQINIYNPCNISNLIDFYKLTTVMMTTRMQAFTQYKFMLVWSSYSNLYINNSHHFTLINKSVHMHQFHVNFILYYILLYF